MSITKVKKKILIVSKSDDITAKHIKEWIISNGDEFINIDYSASSIEITQVKIEDWEFNFVYKNKEYNIKEFHTVYFHRGTIFLKDYTGVSENSENIKDLLSAFKYYRMAYEYSMNEILHFSIHRFNAIGKNNGGRINKLQTLYQANKSGLKIPKTAAISNKKDLSLFMQQNRNDIITKCLDINMIYYDQCEKKLYHALTCNIGENDLSRIPDKFPLSVFQENIKKILELRIFFIGNQLYPSAIFSQNSKFTQQDYRNYDLDFPNRVLPYSLPKLISIKIINFINQIGLRVGSIDMILTHQNEYVFLEVNPQGQFLAISDYCNFNLGKELAKYITK